MANFTRLYYPHFTTFCNETSEYYKFCDALSSCDDDPDLSRSKFHLKGERSIGAMINILKNSEPDKGTSI
jgi:hypothetical protein